MPQNTSWADTASARAEVVRTLAQIRPGERIAVFVLGEGLRILHDFSSDSASLQSKLKIAANGPGPSSRAPSLSWPFSAAFSYADLLHRRMESRAERSFFQTRRILDTFIALEAIANRVKGLRGRKNLIWVSAAFPLAIGTPDTGGRAGMNQVRTFGAEMERAIRALNSANIAVYPIDARGLSVGNPYINVSTMKALAEETGGTAFYNRNDLHRAVRIALDDTRDLYLLSFSPDDFKEDGAFHRIRIASSRRGVRLRYRRGYYAPGASREQRRPAANTLIKSALESPLDVSEIGIVAQIERGAADSQDLSVVIRIDPRDLHLHPQGDFWSGAISVGLAQLGTAGERYQVAVEHMDISVSRENYESAMKGQGYLGLRMQICNDARASSLRLAVVDKASGRVGSLSMCFPGGPH